MIRRDRKYNLIYIDGSHEGLHPITDFGFCRALIASGGIVMLDDPYWPDVVPVRELCRRRLEKSRGMLEGGRVPGENPGLVPKVRSYSPL